MFKMTPRLWVLAAAAFVGGGTMLKVTLDNNAKAQQLEAAREHTKHVFWCAAYAVGQPFQVTRDNVMYKRILDNLAMLPSDETSILSGKHSNKHSLEYTSKLGQFYIQYDEDKASGLFNAHDNGKYYESNLPYRMAMNVNPKQVVVDYIFDPTLAQISPVDNDGSDALLPTARKKTDQANNRGTKQTEAFVRQLKTHPNQGRSHISFLFKLGAATANAENVSVTAIDADNQKFAQSMVPSLTQDWNRCMASTPQPGFGP